MTGKAITDHVTKARQSETGFPEKVVETTRHLKSPKPLALTGQGNETLVATRDHLRLGSRKRHNDMGNRDLVYF